jgi:uncharacterized protein (DUF169 family)
MTEHLKAIAAQLTRDLNLDLPPVQVSYLDAPPAGVPEHPGGVPSVCTFFALGTEKTFYAGLPKHEDCEIGAFVLGIPPEGTLGSRLMGTIGSMQKEGYLSPGEEAHVPHNAKAPKYVAYGPLGTLPMPPTSVLLFAKPDAAMLALETAGAGIDAQPVPMNGRPMCAIMPIMNNGARVAVSLGCTGSRIYTEMGENRMVVGIRGDHLEQFAQKLTGIVHANLWVKVEDSRRKKESSHPFHRAEH